MANLETSMNTRPIIMTTEEAERAQKANIALTTYSNYIKGWVESFEGYYGVGENGITLFKRRVKESSNYQQIRSLTPMPETTKDDPRNWDSSGIRRFFSPSSSECND